ncbi:MAG: hypothetical protein L3J75_15880 [Methylococcaceae bacterium]|nr:hypothetical protein [Methylococcaceae bacterium]
MEVEKYYLYEGPSVVGLIPCARVIVYDEYNKIDFVSESLLNKAESVFYDAVGNDLEFEHRPQFEKINSVGELFLEVIFFILRMKRHILRNYYGINKLLDSHYEIYFDISKSRGIKEVIFCAEAFIREILLLESREYFKQSYLGLSSSVRFGLRDLFVFDRLLTAKHLDISAQLESGSRVYIGSGKHSRLISGGYLSDTSVIGKQISGDKDRSAYFFTMQGLPCPQQKVATSSQQAVIAANKIGYPVVVKPRSGNKGRAVSVNLLTDQAVIKAYELSKEEMGSRTVVVETFIAGDDHRLLVIDYQLVGAVKRIPAYIIGDGVRTIEGLINYTNSSQRRDGLKLFAIKVDAEIKRFLQDQNLTLDSIPQKYHYIQLRGAANQSLGGTTVDVTDVIHPDNIAMAIEAAQVSMLNIAGVDFVTTDISKSWKQGYGGIVEINAGPGVDLHMYPTEGKPRNISWAMTRAEFKVNEIASIPVVMILGKKKRLSTSNMVAQFLGLNGYNTGLYAQKKTYVNGAENKSYRVGLKDMLINTQIDCAVIETSSADLFSRGSAVEKSNITIISDDFISYNLQGRSYCKDIEKRIIKLAIQLTSSAILLDGHSLYAEEVLEYAPRSMTGLVFVNNHQQTTCFKTHIRMGGWSVYLEKKDKYKIVYQTGNNKTVLDILNEKEYDEKENNLLEYLFSIATLTCFNSCLIEVKNFITLIKGIKLQKNTLALKLVNNKLFITADSSDTSALNHIKTLIINRRKNYILCKNNTDANYYKNVFLDENICFIEKNNRELFDDWKFLSMVVKAKDSVVFISKNSNERKTCMDFIEQQNRGVKNTSQNILNASCLKQLFAGRWTSTVDVDIDSLSYNNHTKGKNDVVLIIETYDVEKIPEIEKRVIQAFKDGATAVISPISPPTLERYNNVLLSDSILLGLKKLALYVMELKAEKTDELIAYDENKLIKVINQLVIG